MKFRPGTDVDPPTDALPSELKSSIDKMTRAFTLPDKELKRIGGNDLVLWFRITLKQDIDPIDFINKLIKLSSVEIAEFAPLPAPPP